MTEPQGVLLGYTVAAMSGAIVGFTLGVIVL